MECKVILSCSLFLVLSCLSLSVSEGNSTEVSTTTASSTTTSSTTTTTTETPEAACKHRSNGTCDQCVSGHSKCYYCETSRECSYFNSLIPGYEKCGSLGDVKWGTCKINFKVMIISVSVVAGLLLIGICVCCCCCCRKRKKSIWSRDQVKWERQREELKMKSDDRKRERQSRTDEIRRKYGLMKGDNNYQRFDA